VNPAIEGTGVGLTIVKQVIELHMGKVWVESDGQGSSTKICFTIKGTKQ
jgi:signal transduction histidine kinase